MKISNSKKSEKENNEKEVISELEVLVQNAQSALDEYMKLSQEDIDAIIKQMALKGNSNQRHLAKMAVQETKRGVFEDKVIKNIFATENIYNYIKDQKSVGVINNNEEEGYMEIAEPVGVICGVTPVTNPTSTTMFKSIIAAKTRNPIIFAFHPTAQNCSVEAAKIVYEAAVAAGAPKHCIQWIKEPSIELTQELMNHPGVSIVLATGGSAMVRSAYSTGKPALGVGAGNVPCFIEKTADVKRAVTDLILSKSFDNGMVCASEQAALIEAPIYDEVITYMKKHLCYFTTKEETKALEKVMFPAEKGGALNAAIVGMKPVNIAALANIKIPEDSKIICCEIEGVGSGYPLSKEKLSSVLAVVKVKNIEQGIEYADTMIKMGGLGHTSVIHSENCSVINSYSEVVKTGRVITNAPAAHGAIGDIYNANIPSLTLGCGTYGKNATTDNVSSVNLINKKRVYKRRATAMRRFDIPEKVLFETGSVQYLEKMENMSRVLIVTDKIMEQLGYVDKVMYHLNKNKLKLSISVFSDVEPDPSFDTVKRGTEAMNSFKPDVIISLGGGSPIDAAKAMWLFYEQPDVDFKALSEKFLDMDKRIYTIPALGEKAKFVAIPTTSGTGSEVTAFAVITDTENNIKYPLADRALYPDVAIIDTDFVMTVPKNVTADTGIDVLTHAIESYVSIVASEFTEPLSLKAIDLIFKYLPLAYKDGSNRLAREKVHKASTLAGMAFTNAFLGINHSLAHKIGGEFHTPHGRTNSILLPHVIKYNGEESPTKFSSFSQYNHFVAPEKYCEIAKFLGLPASTPQEGVESLANAVVKLAKELDMPITLKECGVNEAEYMSRIDVMAENAFNDQCTPANPRMPLVSELGDLLKKAYYGK